MTRFLETRFFLAFFLLLIFFSASNVFATDYTSASFKVMDPVIAPAGFSSSGDFQLWSDIGEVGVGTSSAASFQLGGGFLRFPFASTPAVSATAGDTNVALTWTVSQGLDGWTSSGYDVGQSTASGGPYTYASVGNVTSYTANGLSVGTPYYFVIVVKDIFGNAIATSTEVSATPTAPSSTPPSTGGNGGGGGIISPTTSGTSVILSGRAYPLSQVSVLEDGQLALTTIAGPDSDFTATISNLSSGNYTFSVYSQDKNNVRSSMFTFPIFITSNVTTKISGIFIAPTLSVDKSEVKQGDNLAIFGQSVASSQIVININSSQEYVVNQPTDANGVYLLNFDTSPLAIGQHSTKTKSAFNGELSSLSDAVSFLVGNKNVLATTSNAVLKGDLNGDGKVNLIDFSIAAFWYKKSLSASFKTIECQRLNCDGKIDLTDFSIMAYYWTG